MSVTRHHAEWLSLVEVSGPFVSLPVLMRTFPQGLEPRDPAQAKALRAAYEEWQDDPGAPGRQRAWVLHVLTRLLGYPEDQIAEGQTLPPGLEANMPEMGETLRPDFALASPAASGTNSPAGSDTAGQAQLLIVGYPAGQALDRPVTGKHWKATPATRMMELLHGANVPLGLVTNGEHWMLVYAPRGETTGYASWYGALWLDESVTLRAFHSLLGVRRLLGVAADSTLSALLKASASDQQEVTDQLGYQVREAVEVLVQSFDALDKDSGRTLLKGVGPTAQYDAALTIMMRLVFLFSAEERGLLHLGRPLYDDNYAVSTLQEQLQEVADRHGEEVLERRYDAWARLLASFRAVHGGLRHQDLLMPAYGGSLFDPDRYPFLEGRAAGTNWHHTAADPLAVNNRVVLHLLNSLQRLRTKAGGAGQGGYETRRVSFRALGVEQIGHVYEGLLDHTAVRADEPVLGIRGTRKKEPEIPLARLEGLLVQGEDKLMDFLKDETGRSAPALRRELGEGSLIDEHRLRRACDQNEALLARLRPFAGLIRDDSFESPLVVPPGSVYVTAGTNRRSTGTHYTPPSLTEPIVQHTLEPLVYEGPAEGWPREQWRLKSPKEILALKVCDLAMGSGAFLVQACRYLAERLVEAWENEEQRHPGQVLVTPDGQFSEGAPSERLVPADAAERIAIARRVVADRCLYGVDINPMAVEMAKLSLWLITVDATRPFTFLDHAFKCGDSLLGITSLDQLERFSLRPTDGSSRDAGWFPFATANLWRHIDEAKKKREVLEAMPSDTPEQIAAKAALYAEAEEAVAKLNAAADVLVAVELKGLKGRAYEAEREAAADQMMAYWAKGLLGLQQYAKGLVGEQRCMHWGLAFPEIIERGGFDAFIGNPPFMGGKKISGALGADYLNFLKIVFQATGATTDLCAYFFRKAIALLHDCGFMSLLATNTIAEGDTRDVGLGYITETATIYRAVRSQPWPGIANLSISVVCLTKTSWDGPRSLDGQTVDTITPMLQSDASLNKTPVALTVNLGHCFMGTIILGEGFIIQSADAKQLLEQDPKNADVICRYMNGDDLANRYDQSPSRWVINFGERSEREAKNYNIPYQIVCEKVKPQRDKVKRSAYREKWWQFAEKCTALYRSISGCDKVLICGNVTKHLSFAFVESNNAVFTANVFVFDLQTWEDFACLQSSIHELFARTFSPTLETRLSYSPRDAFAPFPFPKPIRALRDAGSEYYNARHSIMNVRREGLTRTYNRFHDPAETSTDIAELHRLHFQMDRAVAAAYGWQDLDLGHGFHETKQGIRFTISEPARRAVLERLLALNHQRYAEEVAAGLHDKKAKNQAGAKRGRRKDDDSGQVAMDL